MSSLKGGLISFKPPQNKDFIKKIGEKPFEDYFDMEFINDETSVDFHFDMLDVGDEYSNPDRYNNEEDGE